MIIKEYLLTSYFEIMRTAFDCKLKIEEVNINTNINLLNLNNANTKN